MTFASPPVTVADLDALEREFAPQFSTLKAFVDSWSACKAWCAEKRIPVTVDGAHRWLVKDLEADAVNVWQPHEDPLAEAHASQFEFPADLESVYVERGDLHDWTGIDEGTHEDAVARHVQICKRCQIGIESRRRADLLASAAGKQPFPSLGKQLRVARQQFEANP